MILDSGEYKDGGVVASWSFAKYSLGKNWNLANNLKVMEEIIRKFENCGLITNIHGEIDYFGTNKKKEFSSDVQGLFDLILPLEMEVPQIGSHVLSLVCAGEIFDLNRKKRMSLGVYDNLIKLDFFFAESGINITICTNSYIWLPFDLKGKSQLGLYTANLGRLSKAMQKIIDMGFNLQGGDFLDVDNMYVNLSGLYMENKADEEGIIDVISWQE